MELIRQELEREFGKGKLVAYFDVRKVKKSYENDRSRKRQKQEAAQILILKNTISWEMHGRNLKRISSLKNDRNIKSTKSCPSAAETASKERKYCNTKKETKQLPSLNSYVEAQSRNRQHKENVEPKSDFIIRPNNKNFPQINPAAVSNEAYSTFQPQRDVGNVVYLQNETKEFSSTYSGPMKNHQKRTKSNNSASLPGATEMNHRSSSVSKIMPRSTPVDSAQNVSSGSTSKIKKCLTAQENLSNIPEGTAFDNLSVLYAQIIKKETSDTERQKQIVPLDQGLKEFEKYLKPVSEVPKFTRSIGVNTEKEALEKKDVQAKQNAKKIEKYLKPVSRTPSRSIAVNTIEEDENEEVHISNHNTESASSTDCNSSAADGHSYNKLRVKRTKNSGGNTSEWNENPVGHDFHETNVFFDTVPDLSRTPSFSDNSHSLISKHNLLDNIKSPNKISVIYPPIEFNYSESSMPEHSDSQQSSELYLTKVGKEHSHIRHEDFDVPFLLKSYRVPEKKKSKKSFKSKVNAAFKQLLHGKDEGIEAEI